MAGAVVGDGAEKSQVPGFQDRNGPAATDVFLRDLDLGATQLVSATAAGGTEGGNGASGEAASAQSIAPG